MDSLKIYMWLNMKTCVPPTKRNNLLEFFGSIEEVYNAKENHYDECSFLSPSMKKALVDKSMKTVDNELRLAEKEKISIISCTHPYYPALLSEIHTPPIILYVKGDSSLLKSSLTFSIVGTRNPSAYGVNCAMNISEQLARCGMTIISGLAMGIDTAAHTGALRGGNTIGVMGCGLLVDYPSGNGVTRRKIAQEGAIISEFPLMTPPNPSNFPQRNRIISGMSLGTAVIEAGKRSGSLITAGLAAEQGRDVFALPGNINSKSSEGTNRLLKDGAIFLLDYTDILSEYIARYPYLFDINPEAKSNPEVSVPVKATDNEKAAECKVDSKDKAILKLIAESPMHINDIASKSGMDISEINSMLTLLMIKGEIGELPGKFYIKK